MSNWKVFSKTIDLGDGREITIETGKMARQADGAVLVRMGDAVLLATVVSKKEPKPGMNFFPLSVDYQEKFASAGRIPGGFFKREARPSEYEILICRLVDRALRPLFPDEYYNETQILISLISSDPEVMPDALAGLAASAAISVSDIPFKGPISEARVARVEGEFIVNPSVSDLEKADLNILMGATEENVMMVEGETKECSEEDLIEAIKVGHEAIKIQCQAQNDLRAICGKEKREIPLPPADEEIYAKVAELTSEKIYEVAKGALSKKNRGESFSAIKDELIETMFGEEEEPDADQVAFAKKYYKKVQKEVIRKMILTDRTRLDGRELNEVRPLLIETDLLPSPHGCALFCRGETQSLTTCTLGTKQDEQMHDKATGLSFSNFMLHYNFPPFSTGEAKPMRGTSRREIGHGMLAKRSIEQVMPDAENNPYTVRVVSDILESNGSSSMATVCAASLALMDAGVQIKTGVSGIAMGLITDGNDFAVLSDILGDEDHLGDMDFKVTGTINGICAVQMDIKVDGLPYEILTQALLQAKEGRLHILSQMDEIMDTPRTEPKPHAPRIVKIFIPGDMIGAIIGPGGKVIQAIQKETETVIVVQEDEEHKEYKRGIVLISSSNKAAIDAAVKWVEELIAVPEVGTVYKGIVKSVVDFGAFVEFMRGKEGLLHISEISWSRLENMDGVFEVGDEIEVKLLDVDQRSGKFKLSRKVLLDKPEGYVDRPRGGGGFNRDRGGDRRGGGRDRRDNRGGGGRRDDRNRR
ncbi:MAG: polyribonucleotide nucleotidyltransferase [Chitinophagales bacterium]